MATLERMFLHVCPFNSTGDRYELDSYTNAASIGTTGKDIELGSKGQCPFFQHGKSSMLGNVIPGSDEILGSLNTSASATKAHPNTRSQVSAKLKLSQPSIL